MRLLDRELGEKVFVDATEDIADGLMDPLAIEPPHQVFEHFGLEDAVILWQNALQWLELASMAVMASVTSPAGRCRWLRRGA